MSKVYQAVKPWPTTESQVSGMKMLVRAVPQCYNNMLRDMKSQGSELKAESL